MQDTLLKWYEQQLILPSYGYFKRGIYREYRVLGGTLSTSFHVTDDFPRVRS